MPTPEAEATRPPPVISKTPQRPAIPIIGDALPRIRNALAGVATNPRQRTTLIIILAITLLMTVTAFMYLMLRKR